MTSSQIKAIFHTPQQRSYVGQNFTLTDLSAVVDQNKEKMSRDRCRTDFNRIKKDQERVCMTTSDDWLILTSFYGEKGRKRFSSNKFQKIPKIPNIKKKFKIFQQNSKYFKICQKSNKQKPKYSKVFNKIPKNYTIPGKSKNLKKG
jgi:hypothetical protein